MQTQFLGDGTQEFNYLNNAIRLILFFSFYSLYIYIYIYFKILFFRERGREGEREGDKHSVASHTPATQAYALTGNQTNNTLVPRPLLSPLSNTSQGPLS